MNYPNVRLMTHTAPWEITENGAEVYNVVTWQPDSISDVDTVLIGAASAADEVLAQSLRDKQVSVCLIGDCFQPRDIELAIIDGHRVGREI